jgi:hypothetical protein
MTFAEIKETVKQAFRDGDRRELRPSAIVLASPEYYEWKNNVGVTEMTFPFPTLFGVRVLEDHDQTYRAGTPHYVPIDIHFKPIRPFR